MFIVGNYSFRMKPVLVRWQAYSCFFTKFHALKMQLTGRNYYAITGILNKARKRAPTLPRVFAKSNGRRMTDTFSYSLRINNICSVSGIILPMGTRVSFLFLILSDIYLTLPGFFL